MSLTDIPRPAVTEEPQSAWPVLLRRLVIWALFLALLYLARDFFFTAFMTFMFSYLTLAIVGFCMRKWSNDQERGWLRRLLTVAVFVFVPMALLGVGALVVPKLIEQGQRLGGWLSQVSPETEVSHILEDYVGPAEFRRNYGGPGDARYQKALEEFKKTGVTHVEAYNQFPKLEAWIEGGFSKQFIEKESGNIRSHLIVEGTSSKDFEQWFLTEKLPGLQARAKSELSGTNATEANNDPLVRVAGSNKPEQVLQQVRRDPSVLATLRQEWLRHALERGLADAKKSQLYQDQLRTFYENQRSQSPDSIPYDFEQFIALQQVRPSGRRAFGDALAKMKPSSGSEGDLQLMSDFEAAKKHDLFQAWWSASSSAKFVRQQVESSVSGNGAGHVQHIVTSLLNIPLDLGTALLLSLFICIDFPRLKRATRSLRDTWLREVYDEMAPALSNLALLIGRAMHAQGLIALCNATLLFLALTFLGVEHAVLLGGAVFVLCLVPTLGTLIAWVLLVGVALVQPGGGFALALKVSGAVVFVVLLETFVFSPRILGRMMELHPVLIIAILPIAQYFFGVWGLILATPVAVYVIHVLILQRGLPGGTGSDREPVKRSNDADVPRVPDPGQKSSPTFAQPFLPSE